MGPFASGDRGAPSPLLAPLAGEGAAARCHGGRRGQGFIHCSGRGCRGDSEVLNSSES